MVYQVYHSKKESKIKVRTLQKIFLQYRYTFNSRGFYLYNKHYYFCENRRVAIELAKTIKGRWIESLEIQVDKIKEIEI